MGTNRRHRRRKPLHVAAALGKAPGLLPPSRPKDTPPARFDVISYGPDGFEEARASSAEEAHRFLGRRAMVWIDVEGVADTEALARMGELFKLHKLALEDTNHLCQRPKLDFYDGTVFVALWMLHDGDAIVREQLSIFAGPGFVLTFQEGSVAGDCLGSIRARLRDSAASRERRGGADYLLYAILDATVDSYFPILEDRGERLDTIEAEVFRRPKPTQLHELHRIRHDLQLLRRAIWPLRGVFEPLVGGHHVLVSPETRPYFRDANDHVLRLLDLIESDRELTASLMDVYLSSLSLRMNEVMKVLAVISTIFMPLSFIAGVYGMNFEHMPELRKVWAYPATLGTMAATAAGLLYFFYRKGWLGEREAPDRGDDQDP